MEEELFDWIMDLRGRNVNAYVCRSSLFIDVMTPDHTAKRVSFFLQCHICGCGKHIHVIPDY